MQKAKLRTINSRLNKLDMPEIMLRIHYLCIDRINYKVVVGLFVSKNMAKHDRDEQSAKLCEIYLHMPMFSCAH